MNEDIKNIMDHWPYEPGTIQVRRIIANDGSVKIQMRLNLGLLQMESTGRPDGRRPHGKESLLDYFEGKLADYMLRHGTDEGFTVGSRACEQLREEGVLYYHRYLSNLHLGEYGAVVRDTTRNLHLQDFMLKYARHRADRGSLESHRPYVTMMNAQAKAHLALEEDDLDRALAEVNSGAEKIRTFFSEHDQPELTRQSDELQALLRLREQIVARRPRSRLDVLRERLAQAVQAEQFERAANLRDEIRRLEENQSETQHPSPETT